MSEAKQHILQDDPTGEAEAVCTCGVWRLVGMRIAGASEESPEQKSARVNEQFQKHLNAVQGTRGGAQA